MPSAGGSARTYEVATPTEADDLALSDWAYDCFNAPDLFIQTAFPWGEDGTILHDKEGPDDWQMTVCRKLRESLEAGVEAGAATRAAIRLAVSSGHGIGKTALMAWLVLWFMTTRPHPQIVVTANTESQLRTKTWRELAKWWKLCLNQHWFLWTATQFKFLGAPETWFATAQPWSESNAEAFAGTHEQHVLLLFDEASKIADIIWETAEGAMTTHGAMWIAFGNPTRNTGRFRQCFTKFRKRWILLKIDSRTAKMANRAQLDEWIEDYGEDSDFVRVRVRGEFPRSGPLQLIAVDVVERAQRRQIALNTIPSSVPLLMGADIARGGENQTVFILRQGRVLHKTIVRLDIRDLMQVAARLIEVKRVWRPDFVLIDANGLGAGVYDRVISLGHTNVLPVLMGDRSKVVKKKTYFNPRIESWYSMKTWMETADIPDDYQLQEDLIGPEYSFTSDNLMRLESKEDMIKRGIPSPDTGDAVALTFAEPIATKRAESGAGSHEPEVE